MVDSTSIFSPISLYIPYGGIGDIFIIICNYLISIGNFSTLNIKKSGKRFRILLINLAERLIFF